VSLQLGGCHEPHLTGEQRAVLKAQVAELHLVPLLHMLVQRLVAPTPRVAHGAADGQQLPGLHEVLVGVHEEHLCLRQHLHPGEGGLQSAAVELEALKGHRGGGGGGAVDDHHFRVVFAHRAALVSGLHSHAESADVADGVVAATHRGARDDIGAQQTDLALLLP
jgi:hypothetical protein